MRYVVLYHPTPNLALSEAMKAEQEKSINTHLGSSLDEIIAHLHHAKIGPGQLVGVWALTDEAKVDLEAREAAAIPVVSHVWGVKNN